MIEVEKKYHLTPSQEASLLEGARDLGEQLVEDAYYDTPDYRLTRNDMWFRNRNGTFELKLPLESGSGSYGATNRYHELTDLDAIRHELGLTGPEDFETALAMAGITRFMTCYATRRSYEKDGFHIDIDAAKYRDTNFEYAVAEIELLIESVNDVEEAERRIFAFAANFALDTDRVILGKVSAYLQAERPDHYEALIAAGVLK